METTSSARERIFAAADELYQETGRRAMPTVDAVRKLAKVNMNDASTGMREWRRAQGTQIAPMTLQAPDTLQHSNAAALAALWSEAITLANETLRAAEAGWAAERAESEALREQMANAYEAQERELVAAQCELMQVRAEIISANSDAATLRKLMESMARDREAAVATARQANAQAVEIERRAADLRTELDHAHRLMDKSATALTAQQATHAAAMASLHAELAQQRQHSARDVAAAHSTLAEAREEAAGLRGKLDALAGHRRPGAGRSRLRKEPDGPTTE